MQPAHPQLPCAFLLFSSAPPLRTIRQSNNNKKAISRFQILFSQPYASSRRIKHPGAPRVFEDNTGDFDH
jgi:hypothetical protein